MCKLYLAAFMEDTNHGPGKKISISDSKPDDFEVDGAFEPFKPGEGIIDTYKAKQIDNQDEASKAFVNAYSQQLDRFFTEAKEDAKERRCKVTDLLPFKDGDTLLSWERAQYMSYRPLLARYLNENGFSVNLK